MRKSRKKRKGHESKIAVIEETADNIYSIKFILQSLGYPVESYSIREPLAEQLEAFEPRLIIVDMMIPSGGGYGVIRSLRTKGGRLSKIPILAITADAMEGKEKDVREAGGDDILAKPYNVADLQQKLKHWLGEDEGSEDEV